MINVHYKTFRGSLRHKALDNFIKTITTYVVDSYSQDHLTIKYLKEV